MSDDELDRERILINLTDLAEIGLACPVCDRSKNDPSGIPMQTVGRSENGSKVFACIWPCAAEIARRQRG